MKALIVVDMQEDYIGEKAKHKFENKESLIKSINDKIQTYIQDNYSVIYMKNIRKGYVSDFVKNLYIQKNIVFEKEKSSCFSNTAFIKYLDDNRINEIEVVGIDGNCCVKSTAIDAAKRGYKSIISLHNVGVVNKERFKKAIEKLKDNKVLIVE